MDTFDEQYVTEERCMTALERTHWPSGSACPSCGSAKHTVAWHARVKALQCCACRQQTTPTGGTIFHATKLGLKTCFRAMCLLKLMRLLGGTTSTGWCFKHNLLQVITKREESRKRDGRADVDDTYFAGENPVSKAGRGSKNKVSFIAALKTSQVEYPVRAAFSRVKTVLGSIKTTTPGTYHAFDFHKYGYLYLAEAKYRYNRRFELSIIMSRLLFAVSHSRMRTETWLSLLKMGINQNV